MSGRSLAQFKRSAEQAPDLAEKVKAGTLALDRGERIIRDREAQARLEAQARADAAADGATTRVDIRHGDFRDVSTTCHRRRAGGQSFRSVRNFSTSSRSRP